MLTFGAGVLCYGLAFYGVYKNKSTRDISFLCALGSIDIFASIAWSAWQVVAFLLCACVLYAWYYVYPRYKTMKIMRTAAQEVIDRLLKEGYVCQHGAIVINNPKVQDIVKYSIEIDDEKKILYLKEK
mgnify:FL=1